MRSLSQKLLKFYLPQSHWQSDISPDPDAGAGLVPLAGAGP